MTSASNACLGEGSLCFARDREADADRLGAGRSLTLGILVDRWPLRFMMRWAGADEGAEEESGKRPQEDA